MRTYFISSTFDHPIESLLNWASNPASLLAICATLC